MTIAHQLLDFALSYAIPQTFRWLVAFAPLWIPFILLEYAWTLWVVYRRVRWIRSQKKVLLEIKLPQETFKSPAAMELVLNALLQTGGEGTPVERYWEGKARPWCSLELCSIGGDIRFFIWCFDGQKNTIMANIYASYPDMAVYEVEDYTTPVAHNLEAYDMFASEYGFVKPDAYPIKTYVDYGLSNDPDEEFKVDPLAPLIESMGSIKKDSQIWYQFIVRAHVAEKNHFNQKQPDKYVEDAKAEVKKIAEKASEQVEGKDIQHMERLSEGDKEAIRAIEKSLGKFAFDVGIRCINIVPKGSGGLAVGVVKGGFRQFGSNNLNGIAPKAAEFPYPWQDKSGKKLAGWKEALFHFYRQRAYFHPPYPGDLPYNKPLVMTTEELATIYHFPGSVVKTPSLRRIPSKRADAPANLPI